MKLKLFLHEKAVSQFPVATDVQVKDAAVVCIRHHRVYGGLRASGTHPNQVQSKIIFSTLWGSSFPESLSSGSRSLLLGDGTSITDLNPCSAFPNTTLLVVWSSLDLAWTSFHTAP